MFCRGNAGERHSPTIFAGGTPFPLTKTMRGGTPFLLTRIKPLGTPFIMCDVLFDISELSETLQHNSINIVKADKCIKRSMRRIESLKHKTGTKMMIVNDSVKDGKFGIVPLSSNRRHISVDANALIY